MTNQPVINHSVSELSNQNLIEEKGLSSLRKKWSRSNYIINKKYEDGICMSTFNIKKFDKNIIKRLHVGIFKNTKENIDEDTGEVSSTEDWNIKIDFTLFNDKYHDTFMTHVINGVFPYDKDRVKNRKNKIKGRIKRLSGTSSPTTETISEIAGLEEELIYIEETKKSFDEMVFDSTGKKRLNKGLQERFGYFPCIKSVFTNGNFKRENSIPFMKAWIDMPNGKYGNGTLTLMIGLNFFEISIQALPEPAICEIKSSDKSKRNYLVSVGFFHRDKADSSIGSGWLGYQN